MELTHVLLSPKEMRPPLPTYLHITHTSFLLAFVWQQHHTKEFGYGFDDSKSIDCCKSTKNEEKTVKRSNDSCQTLICVVSFSQKQSLRKY